jgi:hypothetical protein
MKRSNSKRPIDQSREVVDFMTEFARFLLAAGISRNRFSRIVEIAYFQAASAKARFQNNRLNQSAVAAMTGLTRTQVRAMLRKVQGTLERANDRLDRIVTAWTSDAEYTTAAFSPRRLRIVGPRPSFSTLVRKAGGDIPPRSVLRELERQQLVLVEGGYVKLAKVTHSEVQFRLLRQLSRSLTRMIQGMGEAEQRDSPIRAVTMEVNFPALSGAGRILMQRRLSKILRALIVDVEAAGVAVGMESPSRNRNGKGRMSQARLLLLTHEKES